MVREYIEDERVGKYFDYINWDNSTVLIRSAFMINGHRFLEIVKIHSEDYEIAFTYGEGYEHFYMNFMELDI